MSLLQLLNYSTYLVCFNVSNYILICVYIIYYIMYINTLLLIGIDQPPQTSPGPQTHIPIKTGPGLVNLKIKQSVNLKFSLI